MAAVQQQVPTPERQKRSASFMESMEEEMRRVAEHLERRNRRASQRSSQKGMEPMNGYSVEGRRGYSFSESIGYDAGVRRPRKSRINKYPRQFNTNTLPNQSYSPPPEPETLQRPPTPLSAPPEGRDAIPEPPELEGRGEEGGSEEATDVAQTVENAEKEASITPISASVPEPLPEAKVFSPSVTQQSPTSVVAEPPVDRLPAEDAPHYRQTPEAITSPPPAGMTPRTPSPEKDAEPKDQQSSTPMTNGIAKNHLQSHGDDPKETNTEAQQLSTPEVKSVSVKPSAPKLSRSPIPEVAMKPQRDDHRHTAIAKHELRSGPDSKIHITVSSSVDKSRRWDELSSLVKELQGQLREKEEDIKVLQRKHERETKEKDEQLKRMSKDNHRLEREKWELLKRARDAAERSLHLRTQLDLKEGSFRAAQVELERSRDELVSVKSANTSLRALLSDLRAPRSSVDMAVQVDLGGPLRRNRSIELALTQGLSEDIDSGFERSGEFRMSSSTIGETWSERWDREISIGSSIFEQESRELTPVLTPTATPLSTPVATPQLTEKKVKKRKPALFSKIRKSTGKRGSVDGLDLSRSSLIRGRGVSATPISFPYAVITPEMQAHWRVLDDFRSVPFSQWNLKAIVAWMEAGIGMSQYTAAVRERVTSGHAMLSLTDSDMEKKLGIINFLHRRKLRLAIEEQRGVASACQYRYASKIDHSWVANEWAADIGLPHLTEALSINLVDGRVLNSLTKEDIKKHLRLVKKSEQLSFLSGVELLRMHDFNREAIQEHRRTAHNPLYWTNREVCDWLKDIHLEEYANSVLGSGVHGALLFLERSHFTSEQLANILYISGSKPQLRRHLATELARLFSEDVSEACAQLPPSLSSSPMRFRSPSVPLPDCPHPTHRNSLNHISPKHSSPQNRSPPTPRLASSLGFYRTSSHPNFAEQHRQQAQERVRLSLRESALRSISMVREEPFVRSVTPTILSSKSSTAV